MDEWRSAGEVASELLRRECLIKDFKHVRPALEHLVSLGLIERVQGARKGRGRRAKWLYRAVRDLESRVEVRGHKHSPEAMTHYKPARRASRVRCGMSRCRAPSNGSNGLQCFSIHNNKPSCRRRL